MKEIEIMRHIILLSLCIVAVASGSSSANMFEIEVDANQSSVEGRLGITRPLGDSGVTMSGLFNLINSDEEDDYTLGGLSLSLGNTVLSEMLRLDIGFKGLWGTVKQGRNEGDMIGSAFLLSFIYDIPGIEVYYDMPLDFELSGNASLAPESLSFGDANSYMDFRLCLGLHILGDKIGTLTLGYRGLRAEFGEGKKEWDFSDNSIFGGFKFRF